MWREACGSLKTPLGRHRPKNRDLSPRRRTRTTGTPTRPRTSLDGLRRPPTSPTPQQRQPASHEPSPTTRQQGPVMCHPMTPTLPSAPRSVFATDSHRTSAKSPPIAAADISRHLLPHHPTRSTSPISSINLPLLRHVRQDEHAYAVFHPDRRPSLHKTTSFGCHYTDPSLVTHGSLTA